MSFFFPFFYFEYRIRKGDGCKSSWEIKISFLLTSDVQTQTKMKRFIFEGSSKNLLQLNIFNVFTIFLHLELRTTFLLIFSFISVINLFQKETNPLLLWQKRNNERVTLKDLGEPGIIKVLSSISFLKNQSFNRFYNGVFRTCG